MMTILCLFFILIFYVFKLIVYLFVYLISIIKPINNLANDFFSQPWDSKLKICLDTLVIGFYTDTFIFFVNKNLKVPFITFSSIIAFLFIWQSVIMTQSFYEKNKFDLFWQSILLSAVPISLVLSSIIKSMPDYFTIITASAVSISGIKDLCKNIYNLKFKDTEYTNVVHFARTRKSKIMSIEDFAKQFVSKNNINFKRLDNFDDFDDVEEATKKFKAKNPAKEIPDGYVVTRFDENKFIKLVNLDTLVEVSIFSNDSVPFVDVV